MRRLVCGVLALASVAASPAFAQYYGSPYGGRYGGYGGYEDEYDEPPPPRYYRRGPPGYEAPYGRGPRGYYDQRTRLGTVCTTSRGNCQVPPGPISARCRCDIPGFGEKRGAIAY